MEMSVRQDNNSDGTTTCLQDILYLDPPSPSPIPTPSPAPAPAPAPTPTNNNKKERHKSYEKQLLAKLEEKCGNIYHHITATNSKQQQDILSLDPPAPTSTHHSKKERHKSSEKQPLIDKLEGKYGNIYHQTTTTNNKQQQDILFLDPPTQTPTPAPTPTPTPTHNSKKERRKSSEKHPLIDKMEEKYCNIYQQTTTTNSKQQDILSLDPPAQTPTPTPTPTPTHNSKKEGRKSSEKQPLVDKLEGKYGNIHQQTTTNSKQDILFLDPSAPTPTHNCKKERHKSSEMQPLVDKLEGKYGNIHQQTTTNSLQDFFFLDPSAPTPTPTYNSKKERHNSSEKQPLIDKLEEKYGNIHQQTTTTNSKQDVLFLDPSAPTPTPTHNSKKERHNSSELIDKLEGKYGNICQQTTTTNNKQQDILFLDPPAQTPSLSASPSSSPLPSPTPTSTLTPTQTPTPTPTSTHSSKKERHKYSGPQKKLEKLLIQSCNKVCADCGSPDPKWVSLNCGVFICIKCSGIHRSLGVHISKVLSINLDDWAEEQVAAFLELGGNNAANRKYEACLPNDCKKPKPDASIDERLEFIKRKYEQLEFLNSNDQMICTYRPHRNSSCSGSSNDKRHFEKQPTTRHRIGHAFRNSWGRKDAEMKTAKKNSSIMVGMVEFIGLIKVNVVKGTNLAVRDVVTSDPYVILGLGHQSVRTRVIKNNLNPVWNERLMLSIPEHMPPLKVLVYDKDTFSTDDFMGEAEIDIQPLVTAAKAYETTTINETMQLGKWVASKNNTLVKDGLITLVDGNVKQEISLRLQNVERGTLEIELECVPLTQ